MKSTLLIILLIVKIAAYSQADIDKRQCATIEATKLLKIRNPVYKNIADEHFKLNQFIAKQHTQDKQGREEADTMIIPVIVHVIHNGDAIGTNENISQAQIMSQFDVLNEDFQRKKGTLGENTRPVGASIPIKFVPAAVDPDGNVLTECGINRVNGGKDTWDDINDIETLLKPTTIFDPSRYLNIWVVTFGGGMTTRLGYAQMPDFSSLSGIDMQNDVASTDGLVIRFNVFGRTGTLYGNYNKGRTTSHEMGHFLGLLHIWGNNDANLDCSQDDGCDDTPKTTGPIYNCPSSFASCTSGVSAMVDNYMDYVDDACMHTFTIDQKDRMYAVLANSPRRKELLNSNVHTPDLNLSLASADSVITNCSIVNFTVSGANQYIWRTNRSVLTSSGSTFSLKPDSSTIISVKGTTVYGCFTSTYYPLQVEITKCGMLGTKIDFDDEISIFPNPFEEKISIEAMYNILEVKLFNSMGIEMQAQSAFSSQSNKVEITTNDIFKGVYLIKIKTEKGMGIWKMVK